METEEEGRIGRLRSLCRNACNPHLDEGLGMEIQQRITLELQGMAIPLLERLAMSEEDENFRRAAGLIYAWKLACDITVFPVEKAKKLNALISKEGTAAEVKGYVKASLSHLLGWPVEKWNALADAKGPEAERISAAQDVILYCRQNGYWSTLYRIGRDKSMPMKAREMAMFALLEAVPAGAGREDEDFRTIEPGLVPHGFAERVVERLLKEERTAPCVDMDETYLKFLQRIGRKHKVEIAWGDNAQKAVVPAAKGFRKGG